VDGALPFAVAAVAVVGAGDETPRVEGAAADADASGVASEAGAAAAAGAGEVVASGAGAAAGVSEGEDMVSKNRLSGAGGGRSTCNNKRRAGGAKVSLVHSSHVYGALSSGGRRLTS